MFSKDFFRFKEIIFRDNDVRDDLEEEEHENEELKAKYDILFMYTYKC